MDVTWNGEIGANRRQKICREGNASWKTLEDGDSLTLWKFWTLCTNFKGVPSSPPSLYSLVFKRGGLGTTTLFIEKSFRVLFIQSWFNLEIQIYRDCVALWLSRVERVARKFHLRFFFVFLYIYIFCFIVYASISIIVEIICWRWW